MSYPRVQVREQIPPGIRFARMVKCLGMAEGSHSTAQAVARQLYPDDHGIAAVLKAAVAGGATQDADWAGPLVGETSSIYADFAEYVRPQTIIGKFGQPGYPSLTRIPFNTRAIVETSGAGASWVGEGEAIRVARSSYSVDTLQRRKIGAISVLTRELMQSSSPDADTLIRNSLAKAARQAADEAFINPRNPGVANIRPAGIAYGVTALHASGTGVANVRTDAKAMLQAFITAKNPLSSGAWIMSETLALTLSLMVNANGDSAFPEVDPVNGGRFMKLPVIVSESVSDIADSGGQTISLVNAEDIYYANENGVAVTVSAEGSIEMSDGPANSAATPAGAQLVSLFQTDSMGVRVIMEENWARRRDTGVQILEDVAYAVTA